MKFQLYSDLHLEFAHNTVPVWDGESDYLLLAGDIFVTKRPKSYSYILEDMAEAGGWKHIYLIAGNHEFYNNEWFKTLTVLEELDVEGVTFLNNEFVVLDGVVLFGGTMWTDLSDVVSAMHAQLRMNDYLIIRRNTRTLTAPDTTKEFETFKEALTDTLDFFTETPVVVMSHMAPHELSGATEYKGSELNAAYFTDMTEFMAKPNLVAWVHGHMHNSSDYTVEGCRVMANPYGYHGQGFKEVNPNFDLSFGFEV